MSWNVCKAVLLLLKAGSRMVSGEWLMGYFIPERGGCTVGTQCTRLAESQQSDWGGDGALDG